VIADVWIAVTGLLALSWLQFGSARARRWAPFVGLAGQPAWLYAAWQTGQVGMGIVVVAYTVLWAVGCWRALRRSEVQCAA
jgi:hypothetical protein